MPKTVAEIVTFKLNPDIRTEDFVKLSQATEAFCRQNPGFRHRQLSRAEDGTWTDYVVWADMKTAQDVAASFGQQEFAPALMAAIQPDSVAMRHEEIEWAI
ncbi:hypothetical protein [Roseovarius sp.]|jgi:hypothetical protein|uniref:hypothetical protein n=1 Tax=Roseovarius sp. TaxID=1486281 RepID=UPI0026083BC8|nr:hypothetical protein [Roseovarius sp.]